MQDKICSCPVRRSFQADIFPRRIVFVSTSADRIDHISTTTVVEDSAVSYQTKVISLRQTSFRNNSSIAVKMQSCPGYIHLTLK